MNEVTIEVIGAIEGNAVAIEKSGPWSVVVLYSYNGAIFYNKDEVEGVVKLLTEALEKL